ncbi:hypothetical protein COO60DRAFT_238127 [Scenedesmus sp. NREL 46B-D3]|nr:hypothetical protein COO60DRAFT_238127 [Scenedesmus sp. NREL 46B-D3]
MTRRCTLLVLLLLPAAQAGKPRDESTSKWRRPPPPPLGGNGTHLFAGAGEDALSWDSDELNRIQSLHLRDFDSVELAWRGAGLVQQQLKC